ncbi:hypothetical protein DP939_28320 [Spongiactinospora rosea]|uniref:Uncharacterized protein n=1 Tax=Spongiactinospora rosea TaxID=2248750 RepID=A0A366LUB7_9ACTN|nr:hypothetical protein DP939_28320 [Spongiactinospora rosea]
MDSLMLINPLRYAAAGEAARRLVVALASFGIRAEVQWGYGTVRVSLGCGLVVTVERDGICRQPPVEVRGTGPAAVYLSVDEAAVALAEEHARINPPHEEDPHDAAPR